MKLRHKILTFLGMILLAGGVFMVAPASAASGSSCSNHFLGFVPWYDGLTDSSCKIESPAGSDVQGGTDAIAEFVWRIIANVLIDLFMVVGYLAVIIIMYGGYLYIMSNGDPGKAAKGMKTIKSAAIGIILSVLANVIIRTLLNILTG